MRGTPTGTRVPAPGVEPPRRRGRTIPPGPPPRGPRNGRLLVLATLALLALWSALIAALVVLL